MSLPEKRLGIMLELPLAKITRAAVPGARPFEFSEIHCGPLSVRWHRSSRQRAEVAHMRALPVPDRRTADVETVYAPKIVPLRMASDLVEPMAHHVVMTYSSHVQLLQRRSGRSVVMGTARSGVVTGVTRSFQLVFMRPMEYSRIAVLTAPMSFSTALPSMTEVAPK